MRVLYVKDNIREYIAKVYWSLADGLSGQCELCLYGYKNTYYNPKIKTYPDILKYCDFKPDLIIDDYKYGRSQYTYSNLYQVDCKRSFVFGDYWGIPSRASLDYGLKKGAITHIFVFFKEALEKYPEYAHMMYWLPPSIDPEIFKDWEIKKKYLVGFLGAGCNKLKKPYEDRFRITRKLRDAFGETCFTGAHPGWGFFGDDAKLVGKGFSKAINQCRMFVNTSGDIGHCNPKYYEIAASGSLQICTKAAHMEDSGFIDGETCVIVTEENILDRIRWYQQNWEEAERIIENAKRLIASRHTGTIRAKELIQICES